MLNNIVLAPLGAIFVFGATATLALDLGLDGAPPATTTTIPYIGDCTTSTTLTGCAGQVTLVIQTPIAVPECTTTETRTTTPSPTSSPTPGGACLLVDPFCQATGLNIDYYTNPFGGYSSGSLPAGYYLTQNLRPLDASLTNVTFFPQNFFPQQGAYPIAHPDPAFPARAYYVGWRRATNGGVTVDANNFTLVYEGFYRPRTTGAHTLCSTADNENDVFFGHGSAFSCLDGTASAAATPLFVTTGASFQNGIVCRSVDLVAGSYYPIRQVMGNWLGPSAFNFTIQEPGVAFDARTNDFSGRVYPRRCGLFF